MKNKKFDFSGYATKIDLKCSDGRIIRKDAFKHNDGQKVPLVWQHVHSDPSNILGYAVLEHRADGTYAYCTFNDTDAGKNAKMLVEHGDITALSIHANQLKQKGDDVIHGMIREVSLVLAGANPGALIDNLSIQHSDGKYETDDTEAIIYTGEKLSLKDVEMKHKDSQGKDKTISDVFETLNDEQKDVVYAMIAHAMENSAEHGDGDEDDEKLEGDEKKDEKDINHTDKGGKVMKKNVFDNKGKEKTEGEDKKKTTLTHADVKSILAEAQKCGSLKEAVLSHTVTYGIENIDFLFPDARTITPTPDFITREMGWVPGVISGTTHTPFSRIKSTAADITAEQARARGYVKGNLKKEEVISLLRRTTTPTTIYKKQKLDRDDIVDITDLDVVAWLKMEMRMMLDEELARAVLVGDGRPLEINNATNEDKIDETHIRPIYTDEDMYSHHVSIPHADDTFDIVEAIIRSRTNYKGSGNPTLYTTTTNLTDMLLLKDTTGRRLYNTEAELASALRVSKIVEVPVMDGLSREVGTPGVLHNLIGIIVNLKDYVMGADKGGNIAMFDDFDIDYNQYKYLIETRCSGALIHPKSAIVIEQVAQED